MDGHDWNNCWGEVFRIYREEGYGPVRVGDTVGVYYPREIGKWLGCAGHHCGKAPCPGYPDSHSGFTSIHSWSRCWGEVFEIHAKGKRSGGAITSGDIVSLFYVRERRFVSLGFNQFAGKQSCSNSHGVDNCSFRIWKQ